MYRDTKWSTHTLTLPFGTGRKSEAERFPRPQWTLGAAPHGLARKVHFVALCLREQRGRSTTVGSCDDGAGKLHEGHVGTQRRREQICGS